MRRRVPSATVRPDPVSCSVAHWTRGGEGRGGEGRGGEGGGEGRGGAKRRTMIRERGEEQTTKKAILHLISLKSLGFYYLGLCYYCSSCPYDSLLVVVLPATPSVVPRETGFSASGVPSPPVTSRSTPDRPYSSAIVDSVADRQTFWEGGVKNLYPGFIWLGSFAHIRIHTHTGTHTHAQAHTQTHIHQVETRTSKLRRALIGQTLFS